MNGFAIPPSGWVQTYQPYGVPWWLAGIVAAIPIAVLFWLLGVRKAPAHIAALGGAAAAFLVAVLFARMPAHMALASFAFGAAFGILPIGWVVFAAILLYQIAVDTGQFEKMKASIARLTPDRRLQAVLIAFCFSAILEGAAGFGTPVAISAALLVGLGFRPFPAAVLCLIGNTAPVAWGSIGTPLIMLANVSDLPIADLSAMNARILPLVSAIVPLWLVRSMVGWRETREVLPALAVAGLTFAAAQFAGGNWLSAGLVDMIAGGSSLIATAAFLLVWKPRTAWRFAGEEAAPSAASQSRPGAVASLRAWLPFIVLFAFVVGWGMVKANTNIDSARIGPVKARYSIPVPWLDGLVLRMPPVIREARAEKAAYDLNWLSATGTGVLAACIAVSALLGHRPRAFAGSFAAACRRMRLPILAIMPMLGLAYVTRYAGLDAMLGLAFTRTGILYPFFGTFLGWLGVAITGSDTSSNALFGSLQKITAGQLGLDPVLMCAANAAGGAVGKMVNTQSIVVASAATDQTGSEGRLLAAVFWHSIAMAALVALIVLAYAYAFPGGVPRDVKLLG